MTPSASARLAWSLWGLAFLQVVGLGLFWPAADFTPAFALVSASSGLSPRSARWWRRGSPGNADGLALLGAGLLGGLARRTYGYAAYALPATGSSRR